MHTAPVQVTVVEYVSEFFRKYKSRAYGKSISVNAKGGADALMGMLKLVLSKGGREELRIALHCFKDQLTAAVNSAPATRSQQVEELFALLSALVDAAERLRQFSPVKEGLSAAVLEEVRWRLFRVLAGDGFSEAPDVRRRALDLVFLSHMREAAELQQQQQRHKQLVAGGAAAAAGPAAGIAAGIAAANAAAAGFTVGGSSGKPGSPSKAARLLQRRAGGLAGPDVSSWEGLWCSLGAMSGRRMLPLLQSVMADLYLGKLIPGTPAAAVGAAAKAGASQAAAKQQQQLQLQTASISRPAEAGVNTKAAAGTTAPASAAATVGPATAAGIAAAAVGDDAACGVHTPPQRTSDNDAAESSSNQQQDVDGSPSSVDAAAVVTAGHALSAGDAALHGGGPGKQQQQQLEAAAADADDTDARDEGAVEAVYMQLPAAATAAAAAGCALQDAEPGPASSAELPAELALSAELVYAPVLDRSTWVSCASSSVCATDAGSIDGSAFSLSEASLPAAAAAAAAGYDSADGAGLAEQQQQQCQEQEQACCSPCSSPPGAGRSRFAAKFGRLRESVKESVSIGGGNGSGSGSGGAAWKLPRAWVQQLRHGHDKERDKEQQQQQQVSDVELDQQQSVDDDHAAGSGGSSSSTVEQQQGVQCVAPLPAASLAAAASQ